LLIIGSLRIIGGQYDITNHILVLGVALFAIANFFGRLIWGFFSDHLGASLSIFLALLFQSISIISLNIFTLSDSSYLILAFLIGFNLAGILFFLPRKQHMLWSEKSWHNLSLCLPVMQLQALPVQLAVDFYTIFQVRFSCNYPGRIYEPCREVCCFYINSLHRGKMEKC
jgi:MFS transporter, OFA family, oxalate/formate antiporter